MKKAILLLTIICGAVLNSMHESINEPQSELNKKLWQDLPEDIKPIIMMAFAQSGNNLDEAIKNIHKANVVNRTLSQILNKQYGNQKGFITLMHLLADKFNTSTIHVAEKFKTPMAKKYVQQSKALRNAIFSGNIDDVKKLVKEGADINVTKSNWGQTKGYGLLHSALGLRNNVEMIDLLLDLGIDPNQKDEAGRTILEEARVRSENLLHRKDEVINLLENRLEK